MEKQRPYRILIGGGGTGGHVYPAIAIANQIKAEYPDAEILFVGALGKLEMEKVPKAGYPIEGLWISGLQRRLTLDNLSFPIKVVSSLVKSSKILRRFRPDAVVGVGGYASGPVLRRAIGYKIPTLIQEQNSYAGLTNRILGKRADKICVAYENMDRYFPKEKIVLTGNPVRNDISRNDTDKSEALKFFNLRGGNPTILVIGGSLGARTVNESILNGLNDLLYRNIQIIWQVGRFYINEIEEKTAGIESENLRLFPFLDRMDLAYAAADIVVSRAGALAISELCLVGKPVILVPSPNVAEDHQTKNAQALVDRKAAVMIKDKDARRDLVREALVIIDNTDRQKSLTENIVLLGKPNAARDIARELIAMIS